MDEATCEGPYRNDCRSETEKKRILKRQQVSDANPHSLFIVSDIHTAVMKATMHKK